MEATPISDRVYVANTINGEEMWAKDAGYTLEGGSRICRMFVFSTPGGHGSKKLRSADVDLSTAINRINGYPIDTSDPDKWVASVKRALQSRALQGSHSATSNTQHQGDGETLPDHVDIATRTQDEDQDDVVPYNQLGLLSSGFMLHPSDLPIAADLLQLNYGLLVEPSDTMVRLWNLEVCETGNHLMDLATFKQFVKEKRVVYREAPARNAEKEANTLAHNGTRRAVESRHAAEMEPNQVIEAADEANH